MSKIKNTKELKQIHKSLSEVWSLFLDKLKLFYSEFEHYNVSQNYKDKFLANRVRIIRNYKKNGKLPEYQVKVLNDLGFVWNLKELELKNKWRIFIKPKLSDSNKVKRRFT